MTRYLLIAAVVVLAACKSVTPDESHEAVLVKKPMIFGHGGIDPNPIKTGRSFVALTTDAIMVNTQPMQFQEHFDDLMSSDGVPLDFDAALRIKILDSVRLISDYGIDWYKNNVEVEYRNRVRQAVRKHGMNETAISTVAVEQIDDEVTKAMDAYITSINMPVKLIQVTVGRANPPDAVKNQRIETATQEQRKLTEDQRKKAEDARLAAEEARAEADNAYRNKLNLSPGQFIQLEAINMQKSVCAAGKCSFIVGANPAMTFAAP